MGMKNKLVLCGGKIKTTVSCRSNEQIAIQWIMTEYRINEDENTSSDKLVFIYLYILNLYFFYFFFIVIQYYFSDFLLLFCSLIDGLYGRYTCTWT